ncbi:hypothetical protein GF312_02085 [Candidatus Poribacteria bacterium]|nr:hypothetical protein [Candidatus Poribacteria bacterium]
MATRQSMAWLIKHLRGKVHDDNPMALTDGQHYMGDTIRLTCTYTDLSGNADNPYMPEVTVWDTHGSKRMDSAIPIYTGEVGEYHYNYRIPPEGPEGVWRAEFTGTVSGSIRQYPVEFTVIESNRVWSDAELQNILDMHRIHIIRERLNHGADGETYYSRYSMLEDNVKIWDGRHTSSTEISSDKYTVNLIDGAFTLPNTSWEEYYLDAVSYNIHGAVAECMEQLAMDPNKAKSWDRGSVKYTHYDYLEMARHHRGLSGIRSTAIRRTYS